MSRPPLGSRGWHRDFERRQRRFDALWPALFVVAAMGAVFVIALVVLGYLPLWILLI